MRFLPVFILALLGQAVELNDTLNDTLVDTLNDTLVENQTQTSNETAYRKRVCKWRGPYRPAYSPGCSQGCKQFRNVHKAKNACAKRGDCGGITYERHRYGWRWELRRSRHKRRSPHGETTYLKGRCYWKVFGNGLRRRRKMLSVRRGKKCGLSNKLTVRGNRGHLCGFCGGHSTILNFQRNRIRFNNLGGLGPKGGMKAIWWTRVGDLGGRKIDLVMTAIGGAYGAANAKYRRWGRTGRWFARRFHGSLRRGVGSAGSMKAGNYNFLYKFLYTRTKKPATIHYLPLTFYDLDGGKEFVRTYDAVGVAVAKPTGMAGYGCRKHGKGYFCWANGARREYRFPRNFDRLSRYEKMASVTFLFRHKSAFKMNYRTTYDHRVFMFKGSAAIMCKGPSRRRARGRPARGLHRRRARKNIRRRRNVRRRRARNVRRRYRKCKARISNDKALARGHRRRYANRKWSVGCR